VVGFFLLLYIGIAFSTDDALMALMEFTRTSIILTVLFALLPLNSACRIVTETGRYLKRRRALAGKEPAVATDLFDETVTLPVSHLHAPVLPIPEVFPSLPELQDRLGAEGYKTRRTESALTAWRGVGIFPARILYLAGTFCLFAGILISLTTRTSYRISIIEGEPLATPSGNGGIVERIFLGKSSGLILAKDLTMEVAPPDSGEGKQIFGVYPPSHYKGSFVYPRYLGIGLAIRFSAPDLQSGYEKNSVLAIYPPGKEAAVEIPDTPYRIVLSLAEPDDGSDPYMTGRMVFLFKVFKEKEVLFAGSAPTGGEFVHDGYRLVFPDSRRVVITDFIRDFGVFLIWMAAILFVVAGSIWLSVRVFFPRREMLFRAEQDVINACSRAEGRERRHAGVFHEALDLLEARRPDRQSFEGHIR
jgi:hypothetical protein